MSPGKWLMIAVVLAGCGSAVPKYSVSAQGFALEGPGWSAGRSVAINSALIRLESLIPGTTTEFQLMFIEPCYILTNLAGGTIDRPVRTESTLEMVDMGYVLVHADLSPREAAALEAMPGISRSRRVPRTPHSMRKKISSVEKELIGDIIREAVTRHPNAGEDGLFSGTLAFSERWVDIGASHVTVRVRVDARVLAFDPLPQGEVVNGLKRIIRQHIANGRWQEALEAYCALLHREPEVSVDDLPPEVRTAGADTKCGG